MVSMASLWSHGLKKASFSIDGHSKTAMFSNETFFETFFLFNGFDITDQDSRILAKNTHLHLQPKSKIF